MDMTCEKCGGKSFWDNRATKTNPRAPDFKCKNRSCGNGVWLKDSEKAALGAVTSRNGSSPNRPPIVLDKMMSACLKAAVDCAKNLPEGATADHDIILRIAQSLFIARQDGKGILEAEKKVLADLAAKAATEKAEAERKAAEERARMQRLEPEYAQGAGWPDPSVNGPDDLPF